MPTGIEVLFFAMLPIGVLLLVLAWRVGVARDSGIESGLQRDDRKDVWQFVLGSLGVAFLFPACWLVFYAVMLLLE